MRDGEVHVWHARLDAPDLPFDAVQSWLSPLERGRAQRFRFDRDRLRFVAARGFLRALLGRYLGCAAAAVAFHHPAGEKPRLADPAQRLRFNLSHSGTLALAAVAGDREVGADVELVRPLRGADGIAARMLSPPEVAELDAAGDARGAALLVGWTRKEAVLKASGQGLRGDPAAIEVGVRERAVPQRVEFAGQAWTVASVPVATGYVAAVAVQGDGVRLVSRGWSW